MISRHTPAALSAARVVSVRFEHHREPLGIGESRPRISWKTSTDKPGWWQSAYEIEVVGADGGSHSSGHVASSESVLVAWPGPPLSSRTRRGVRVRVWGPDGVIPSEWSDVSDVEAGLLLPDDWSARLVVPDWDDDMSVPQPVPMLRRSFELSEPVESARLYVTAHGVYQAELNGQRVGDHVMAPGWTSYPTRLRYQTFDVADLLRPGENVLGSLVAEGWYRGRLTWHEGRRNLYGDRSGLVAQLEVKHVDGTRAVIRTDKHWRAARSGIRSAGIYDGEIYDARDTATGWTSPGFDDSTWSGVRALPIQAERFVAPTGPPVRCTQAISPVDIVTSPSGQTIVDFGQNLVGRVQIRVDGEAGQTVTIRHAEALEDGELATRPLRSALATDHYTLRGGGPEEWEPNFTFHGFRYAGISGWPGQVAPADVTAVVIHSDMERTGWFDSSEPLLNQLHDNVIWSMRGNFFDVPTDCPQRDERLGWTGDIQVFAPTGSFLYDCSGVLVSWLRDLATEQLARPTRLPPLVVPDVLDDNFDAAGWGDAAVVVPWVLCHRFGDVEILRQQYASMTAWVDGIASKAGASRLWDTGRQFGDWLDPSAPSDAPEAGRTDTALVATAYFARAAALVSETAALLGNDADAHRYAALADEVRQAFAAEYVTPNGRMASDSQTAFALAIEFGLLPDRQARARAGRRLAQLVHQAGYRIGTGFLGTPLIADALCSAGETQLAYRMLLETACPSFLYPVTMGATTIWERWDSMLPDGSVNPGVTSFNHYALGAFADWLHRTVAGLAPGAAGYRHLDVHPRPGGTLTAASAAHETPYGRAEVTWTVQDDTFRLSVAVPPNCTATIQLPDGSAPRRVTAGSHNFTSTHASPEYPPVPEDDTAGELFPS